MNIYYQNLPKKRMGAGLLITNQEGHILILNPTYKDGWSIPGGVIEQDESPRACCLREAQEEIGLNLNIGNLLVVDYCSNVGLGDSLQFVFDGGILTPDQIAAITLDDENDAFQFLPPEQALTLIPGRLRHRLGLALQAKATNQTIYTDDPVT